jgi:hypothetical protein
MWIGVLAGMAQTRQLARVGHAFLKRAVHSGGCVKPDPGELSCMSHQPRVPEVYIKPLGLRLALLCAFT